MPLLVVPAFLLSATFIALAVSSEPPPSPYWQFSRDNSTQPGSPNELFWSYYGGHGYYGPPSSYAASAAGVRKSWSGAADPSGGAAAVVVVSRGGDEEEGGHADEVDIDNLSLLDLSSRPRMSYGPRRKRSTPQQLLSKAERLKLLKAQLAKIPLYCWKVLVDCRRHRGHVCCPVMPKIVGGGGAVLSAGSRWWTSRGGTRRSSYRSKREADARRKTWEPFYRCPGVDCRVDPHDECCQVDRFLPEGPLDEPALVESMISASYSLFGGDPVTFLTAKKVMFALAFVVSMLVWGALGQRMGLVPKNIVRWTEDSEAESQTERIISATADDPAGVVKRSYEEPSYETRGRKWLQGRRLGWNSPEKLL